MPDESETSPVGGKGVGAFLSAKKGPLPVWGWGIVGVAVIILLLRYRAAKAATASSGAIGAGTVAGGTVGNPQVAASLSDQLGNLSSLLSNQQATVNAAPHGMAGTFDPSSVGGQIVAAYEQYLGRKPTSQELAWRVGLVNSGQRSVAQQVSDIATDPNAAQYQLAQAGNYYGP